MADNPYEAPKSRIEEILVEPRSLAGRGERLGASLLDALISGAVLIPLEYGSGYLHAVMEAARTHGTVPLGEHVFWSLVGIAVFVAIQGYPLVKDGQTWGKKACSIKIVTLDGGLPSIQRIGVRCAVHMLLGRIPYVGWVASLVNVLLIFGEERRCGHDLAAGTRVVQA